MRASAALLAALVCAGAPRAFAQGSGETEASFQSIVVQPGDTLWAIANKFLKDPARWDEIVRHNRLPTKDPTVALPGMTLRVPIRLIKTNLRAAYLVSVVKRVMYRRRETPDWKDGRLRMELFQGDSLRTLEASKARVELMDKELLSLEPNSMAVIKPMDREGDLELHSGSVFAGYARVVTSSARVTPKTQDTRYAASIDSDQTTRVEVYKGAAAVDAQGSRVDVPAGMGTRVMKGLAPEVPKAVPNLPDLDSRFGFPSETKAAEPPPQRSLSLTAPKPEADADKLRGDLADLRIGLPIMGYRVQAAVDREFNRVVFDRTYEPDDRLRPGEVGLKPGSYWWRIRVIDLLGIEGAFSEPRYYSVGLKRGGAVAVDLKKEVTVISPTEGMVIHSGSVRLGGVLRNDRLRVEVGGKAARADEDGNFFAVVPLSMGRNEIVISISDGKGNVAEIVRHVVRDR